MSQIKQNTAGQLVAFPQLLDADVAPVTSGASITVSIDGAAFVSGSGALTHLSNGYWKYAPTQSETNGILLQFVLFDGVDQYVDFVAYTTPKRLEDLNDVATTDIPTEGAIATEVDNELNEAFDAVISAIGTRLADEDYVPPDSAAAIVTALKADETFLALVADALAAKTAAEANSTAIAAVGTTTNEIQVVTDVVNGLIEDSSGNRFTAKALEASPTPTVIVDEEAIAEAVDGQLTTSHGSGSWQTGSSIAGSGSEAVQIRCEDTEENPIDGVAVWITSDAIGTSVVAGTLYSTGSGLTSSFMLDPGTYYVWRQVSGYNFSNPESITVVAS